MITRFSESFYQSAIPIYKKDAGNLMAWAKDFKVLRKVTWG